MQNILDNRVANMPSPEYLRFLETLGPPKNEPALPVEARRAAMDRLAAMVEPSPDILFETATFSGVSVEWVIPPRSDEKTLLMYLHGGGFCLGSARNFRDLVSRIARQSHSLALSVDYRLAPEYPYPAALNDVLAVYRGLLDGGRKATSIILVGDSAGAGLVVSTLFRLRDEGFPLPRAAVCISPFVDLTLSSESLTRNAPFDPLVQRLPISASVERYLQGHRADDPQVSPIFGRFEGLCPMFVLAGGKDALLDDAVRLVAAARAAQIDVTFELWEDMIHIWPYFAAIFSEGQLAVEQIAAYIRQSKRADGIIDTASSS